MVRVLCTAKPEQNRKLPGGESNPALARSSRMTGACTNPIYYQGLVKLCEKNIENLMMDHLIINFLTPSTVHHIST
jgi:hypothetical protein